MPQKNWKKICIVLSSVCLLFGCSLANAADSQILNTRGKIAAVENDKVLITAASVPNGKLGMDVSLLLTPATYYVDNSTGKLAVQAAVKKDALVSAFYDSNLSATTPPEGRAILLVLGIGDSAVDYLRISRVEQEKEQIKVYYDNKIMDISEKVMPGCKALRPGDEVVGWFSLMNAVSANEFNASKALLLNRELSGAEKAAALYKDILYKGKLLVQKERIYNLNNVTYLPLRSVVEALGFKLVWKEGIQSITVQNGEETAALRIDSKDYYEGSTRIVLPNAPQIYEGQTIVPLDFFTDVLNKEITIKHN